MTDKYAGHTPGLWVAVVRPGAKEGAVHGCGGRSLVCRDITAADARLIADAPSLLKRVGELETALGHAVGIIEAHVDRDALGMGGDPRDGQWPLLDEYLHHMRAALNSDAPISVAKEADNG